MRFLSLFSALVLLVLSNEAFAQLPEIGGGNINGNVSMLFQNYKADSLIGARVPDEKSAMNAFANLIYTKGDFTAGIRYESYLPPILGYPTYFKGTGIGYRYASYKSDQIEVTIGNFYDQYGSGMVFRAYEERNLGIDNAMDGFRVKWSPVEGMIIKGMVGRQRAEFDSGIINSEGILRGFDAEVNLNSLRSNWRDTKTQVTLGGSFVSRFQQDDQSALNLPENVGMYGGRVNLQHGLFNLFGEYVEKINDPSADNGFSYKQGRALLVNGNWSKKGMGVAWHSKIIDNVSFRSDRNLNGFGEVPINFVPSATKQHTYNLAATLYPYNTVLSTPYYGEASASIELFYKIKKGSFLGGKYGTNLTFNVAAANGLDITLLNPDDDDQLNVYSTNFFSFDKEAKFIRDINLEVKRKINKKLKVAYTGFYFEFNPEPSPVTQGIKTKGLIYANIHVIELNYKINKKHSIRGEMQGLFTQQDQQDWATALVEYNVSPNWFFAVLDQWNYGNNDADQRVHYLFGTLGYIRNANRISASYGRQRAGVFCIGGVCRVVPASNGLTLSLTSTF